MPLQVKARRDYERRRSQPGGGQGSMGVRNAYGNECNLMVASRPRGYHSRPHFMNLNRSSSSSRGRTGGLLNVALSTAGKETF
jgi:hypothetical protein